ncbi:hypothetical protein AV530_014598 [Patagioenas fasciata monilis]|uniref:Uncharacterized protein n=1 Tax=Patagioenas fasciata monilis TaxID=372326 RepID=A0A1V4KCI9_PATFA|nr:hypothetical protein AV530_014598 [Patagioenas fasciata monilis]
MGTRIVPQASVQLRPCGGTVSHHAKTGTFETSWHTQKNFEELVLDPPRTQQDREEDWKSKSKTNFYRNWASERRTSISWLWHPAMLKSSEAQGPVRKSSLFLKHFDYSMDQELPQEGPAVTPYQ